MRFRDISSRLDEKIVTRPRNLKHYCQTRIAALDALLSQAERLRSVIRAADAADEPQNMLRTFLRYGTGHADAADDLDQIIYLGLNESTFTRFLPILQLRENLAAYVAHGPDFLRYVLSSFDHSDTLTERQRAVFAILDRADAGASEYGYTPGNTDEDYDGAMALRDALVALRDVFTKGYALWADVREKLGEIAKIRGVGDRYRPDHDEVETLFHATAFVTEILRDGWQAEKPDGRRGLGNYGDQREISFTHDLKVAQDLMRALKEVWMIAHGQLTARQIVSWIKKEGIDQEYPNLKSTVGIGVEDGPEHPMFGKRHRAKELHEITGPEETARLYRVYLALSKLRTDPVFTYIDETLAMMASRDLSDIGILACEVRLSPDDEYKLGESEFRVKSDRVVSTRRLV